MFQPQRSENIRPDGIPVLEIVQDSTPDQPAPRRFVPLKRTELKGEVLGPLAGLRLVQTYGIPAEQSDRVIEALYRFPLPGDAAVTAVRVRFGAVEVRTELKERRQAESDYDRAKQEGRQAALVTRESPDVFTLRVAGIRPGEDVTVETCYVQLARAEGPGWSLRLPLTTAPRYVRDDESGSAHSQGQPLALLRDPGHRFTLDLTLRGAGSVESRTHSLDVERAGDHLHVRLRGGETVPDRDCVLSWRPTQAQDRPALQVLLHDDHATGQVYFLALVAPPAVRDPGRGVPREVVLLVDHSGSMEGAKWQAADWAVERFLADLAERDACNLGLFHHTTRWFAKAPRPASPKTVAEATQFLRQHRDTGGTELGVALEQALAQERPTGERARHVLVITDAQVTDAGRILRLADAEAVRPDRRRVSLLCIDAAPNALLATDLAERGGGVARFLTSAPEEEDITTALDEVLADWAEPVLTGLRLEVDRPAVEASGRRSVEPGEAGWSAVDLGDLPAGRAVWVAGRVPRGEAGALSFRVRTGRNREVAGCRLDLAKEADGRPALRALFGAGRVRALESLLHAGYPLDETTARLQRLGYDPGPVLGGQDKVYPENARADVVAALEKLLVREALAFGLASASTAFVAVRTEPGKPVEETVVVANALPAGWSDAFIGGAGGRGGYSLRGAFTGAVGAVMSKTSTPPPAARRMYRQKGGYAPEDMLLHALQDSAPPPAAPPTTAGCYGAPAFESPAAAPPPPTPLFSGVPPFAGGEAILFDSTREQGAGRLPEQTTIEGIEVRFPDGTPDAARLGAGLCLLIFVDDLAAPRARVRLADLVRQRGERPLNLAKRPGQAVRLVLVDPAGTWAQGAPRLEVALRWRA
jgi:Ca-activated chloride channel family protein